jgi:hypothetical protein
MQNDINIVENQENNKCSCILRSRRQMLVNSLGVTSANYQCAQPVNAGQLGRFPYKQAKRLIGVPASIPALHQHFTLGQKERNMFDLKVPEPTSRR